MNIKIEINRMEVTSIEGSSGIFSGDNYHAGWFAMSKTNRGLGGMSGDSNVSNHSVNIVSDPDGIDVLRLPKGNVAKGG